MTGHFQTFQDEHWWNTSFPYTITSTSDAWIPDSDPDESELRRKQRLFREYVQTTRRPEAKWLPPVWCKPVKPVARRWGGRAREQRDRRTS